MENKEHIPVCYEGQDDLIDILATSICSICYNTKSFIDFYIFIKTTRTDLTKV